MARGAEGEAADAGWLYPAKLLQQAGLASRREGVWLIEKGLVLVDGAVHTEPAKKVPPTAHVALRDDVPLPESVAMKPTVLLHKPAGVSSAKGDAEGRFVAACDLLTPPSFCMQSAPFDAEAYAEEERWMQRVLAEPWHLAPAGRLDVNSTGLLLMTQDGAVARRVIDGHNVVKEYLVRCDPPLTPDQLGHLRGDDGPLQLDGHTLLPMEVTPMEAQGGDERAPRLRFRLREGRNRQIRRVVEQVGSVVTDLRRVALGGLRLGRLPRGRWRLVLPAELDAVLPRHPGVRAPASG